MFSFIPDNSKNNIKESLFFNKDSFFPLTPSESIAKYNIIIFDKNNNMITKQFYDDALESYFSHNQIQEIKKTNVCLLYTKGDLEKDSFTELLDKKQLFRSVESNYLKATKKDLIPIINLMLYGGGMF